MRSAHPSFNRVYQTQCFGYGVSLDGRIRGSTHPDEGKISVAIVVIA